MYYKVLTPLKALDLFTAPLTELHITLQPGDICKLLDKTTNILVSLKDQKVIIATFEDIEKNCIEVESPYLDLLYKK